MTSIILTSNVSLQLTEPLKMTDYIKAITLPESMLETEAGTEATVTGWGITQVRMYILRFIFSLHYT